MNEFEKQLANQPLKAIPPEWRTEILVAAKTHSRPVTRTRRLQPLDWLRELLWPCPQAWGALAAIWVVIAIVQLTTSSGTANTSGQVAEANVTSVAVLRRELAELLGPATETRERSPADRPRSSRASNPSFA